MYAVLPIALAVLLVSWFFLRRFTKIWINRPIRITESIFAGITAWLFLLALLTWFGGIVLTLLDFLSKRETIDIWALLFAVLLTGYGSDFIIRARSEMRLDDTQEFLKEALQFRRSAQHRLDLLSLTHMKQSRHNRSLVGNDPDSQERSRLQANLTKEKGLDAQLALLREGKSLDLSDVWRSNVKIHASHDLFEKVEEARIEPARKRLCLFADFSELNETQLKDEMTVLRLNRQVYDFLQTLYTEPWLKPYIPFYESYYLMCRAVRVNKEGVGIFYPFMKVGVPVSELRKLEGLYFNPRRLPEIAALAFNNGAPV
jgi:hypothetical protein